MKDVGTGVDRDSDMILKGCGMSDEVAASVSICRSLLACWRARFLAEAAGMVVDVEGG